MPVQTFGSVTNGTNFDIDFLPIEQWTNPDLIDPLHEWTTLGYLPYDFGISKFAITNEQWEKFELELGLEITGADPGYGTDLCDNGPTKSACPITWYEACQFVNWLNTSTGNPACYKFNGTQGTTDYALDLWTTADAYWDYNLYRNRHTIYCIPSESEWVKAAYWNQNTPGWQEWATPDGSHPTQAGWNFRCCSQDPCRNDFACSVEHGGWSTDPHGQWPVDQGSVELNGTYNMMGNIWEWTETPYEGVFDLLAPRCVRGGNWNHYHRHSGTAGVNDGRRGSRASYAAGTDDHTIGFRVIRLLTV